MATAVYLDIFVGDAQKHAEQQLEYQSTCELLSKHASVYGFPSTPQALSDEEREILQDLDKSLTLRFAPPISLNAGRLIFELNPSPGLSKTTANFLALCTGERGSCKNAPNKKLHYRGCSVHRIVKDFVAQGGDITRGDGSGGESIYGGKFNDEKEGLKIKTQKGSIAMANSGKNSNSSQFFIVLSSDERSISKMNGKYVVFGQLKEGWDTLTRLNEIGGGVDGKPDLPVWIGECGKC